MRRRIRRRRATPSVRRNRFRALWASFRQDRARRVTRYGAWALVISLSLAGLTFAAARAERLVRGEIDGPIGRATLSSANLPEPLDALARADLVETAGELLALPFTSPDLCAKLAERLSTCAWVERVRAVRRLADGRFELDATFRHPAAMVAYGDELFLTDHRAVRLPGSYRYDPAWIVVHGVEKPPPPPGHAWEGRDAHCGVALAVRLAGEPFAGQITAVVVDNLAGRRDARAAEIALATDRPGGRILWGSPIGAEIAENSAEQKLAILRANFRQTGRADAGHPVIGVLTFPDRFTIPG